MSTDRAVSSAGPLDTETLGRWANALFRGEAASEAGAAAARAPFPSSGGEPPAPSAAGTGGPDPAGASGPVAASRFGASLPESPSAYALPDPGRAGGPEQPEPDSAGGVAEARDGVPSPLSPSLSGLALPEGPGPDSFGLPDAEFLKALNPAPLDPGPAAAGYYFLSGPGAERFSPSAPEAGPDPRNTAAPAWTPPSPAAPVPAAAPYGTGGFPGAAAPYGAGGFPGPSAHPPLDPYRVRRDFPILSERVNGRPLVWLDNAATTQKPRAVIERLKYFYEHENSNVHRAAHTLAARSTDAYEAAREKTARFLGAGSAKEIVFTRGATEAINLVAQSWGRANVGPGDEIAVSHLEHHANIVPWQRLAEEKGAKLKVLPVDDDGQIVLAEAARLIGPRTKLLALAQVSNALGTVTPVQALVALAHAAGAKALVDGAQAVSHLRVDVRALDADFYVFSGHKVFGPTGIGALYGKKALLDAMPPWQGGGNMIQDVTFEKTLYHDAPARFEAGTGSIADAVGLGAALDYVEQLGREAVGLYEHQLLEYATHHLLRVPGLRLVGTAREKASVLSFILDGHKTEDVGAALSREGVAVRGGHHCAQPILRRFGLESTVRASLAFYNHCADVDALVGVLRKLAAQKRPL